LLNKEIRQPIRIIRFLLGDFVVDPSVIFFPDRNAMMLAIQCLRTYNKQSQIDIELTPETAMDHIGWSKMIWPPPPWPPGDRSPLQT